MCLLTMSCEIIYRNLRKVLINVQKDGVCY